MKKSIFVLLLILSCAADAAGWTVASDVKRVAIVHNGGVNVRLNPDLTGCVSQSGYGATYASVYPNHPALMTIYSTLVAAQAHGKKVSIYLSDDKCTISEVVLGGTYNTNN